MRCPEGTVGTLLVLNFLPLLLLLPLIKTKQQGGGRQTVRSG